MKNVLSGSDNWQPELITEACESPAPVVEGGMLKWQPVPYAICYVITKNGNVEGFTTATSCEYEAGNEYLIQAVNEYGGLSKAAKADQTSAVGSVETAGDTFKATAVYTIDGKRIADTAKGINVITDGKTSRKVVMK